MVTSSRNKIFSLQNYLERNRPGAIDLSMLIFMCAPVHACNLPPCRCLPACLPALMLYIDAIALYAERAYTRALLAAYAVSCTVYNFL